MCLSANRTKVLENTGPAPDVPAVNFVLDYKQKQAEVNKVINYLKKLLRDESGQGMTEYALILALVAIGAIVAMTALREQIVAVFQAVTNTLTGAL
jgi:pilus assembly protein Flp/PilA